MRNGLSLRWKRDLHIDTCGSVEVPSCSVRRELIAPMTCTTSLTIPCTRSSDLPITYTHICIFLHPAYNMRTRIWIFTYEHTLVPPPVSYPSPAAATCQLHTHTYLPFYTSPPIIYVHVFTYIHMSTHIWTYTCTTSLTIPCTRSSDLLIHIFTFLNPAYNIRTCIYI